MLSRGHSRARPGNPPPPRPLFFSLGAQFAKVMKPIAEVSASELAAAVGELR